jgi:hypothetical protein
MVLPSLESAVQRGSGDLQRPANIHILSAKSAERRGNDPRRDVPSKINAELMIEPVDRN